MADRKKTPMFQSSIPSAYDFVDFTSAGNPNSSLMKLDRASELKSSHVLQDQSYQDVGGSKFGFENIIKQNNKPAEKSSQMSGFNNMISKQETNYQSNNFVSSIDSPSFIHKKNQSNQQRPGEYSQNPNINTGSSKKQFQVYPTKNPNFQPSNNFSNNNHVPQATFTKNHDNQNSMMGNNFQRKSNVYKPAQYPVEPVYSGIKTTPNASLSPSKFGEPGNQQMQWDAPNSPLKRQKASNLGQNNTKWSNEPISPQYPNQKKYGQFSYGESKTIQQASQPLGFVPQQPAPQPISVNKTSNTTRTSSSESGLTDESFLELLPEPTRSNLRAMIQRNKNPQY